MTIAPRTVVLFVAVALGSLLVLAGAYAVRSVLVQLIVAIVLAMAELAHIAQPISASSDSAERPWRHHHDMTTFFNHPFAYAREAA